MIGGVRLAFFRETQKFYISYLMLKPAYRKQLYGTFLMGSIFYLMQLNNIKIIYADALPGLLELYLKFGCEKIGEKYFKYGFDCPWTPVRYILGTNPQFEELLISKVKRFLNPDEGMWNFRPKIALCSNMTQYETCLNDLIQTRCFHEILPHYCQDAGIIPKSKLSNLVHAEDILYRHDLKDSLSTPGEDKKIDHSLHFEYFNQNFSGKNIIVARQNSPIVSLAKCYAMLTGKKLFLVEDWKNLPGLTERNSVLLFPEDNECTYDWYEQMRTRLKDMKWGIISGASLEVVSWMVIKNILYYIEPVTGIDVFLSPLEKRRETLNHTNNQQYIIFDKNNYDEKSIKEKLLSENIRILSVFTHGRGDVIYDSKLYFCGKNPAAELKESSSGIIPTPIIPCCDVQNNNDCYKQGEQVFACDVSAKLLFANTCFAFANIFPRKYTVGWSFLQSFASHVITTEKAKDGISVENIFFLCLLKHGFDIGESVIFLNRCITHCYIEKESYFIFGDPSLRLFPQASGKQTFSYSQESSRIKFLINPSQPVSLFYVDIDLDIIGDVNKELYFYTTKNIEANYFYYINEKENNLRLFVFKLDGLPQEIELYFQTDNSINYCFKWGQFYLNNWRANRFFKLSYSGEKGLTNSVANDATNLAKLHFIGQHSLFDNEKLIRKSNELFKKTLQSDQMYTEHLLDLIINKSWIITDSYQELFTVKENLELERCYICGEILHIRGARHRVLEEFIRYHYNCVNCGAIGDIPEGFVLPKIIGDHVFVPGNENKQIIELTNPFPLELKGYLGIRVYQSTDYNISYSPEIIEIKIPPSGVRQFEFKFSLGGNVPRHLLFFKSIAVIGGAILYSQKNIYITDQPLTSPSQPTPPGNQ